MVTNDELGMRLTALYGGATITATREKGECVIRLGFPSNDPGVDAATILARHPKRREALKMAIRDAEAHIPTEREMGKAAVVGQYKHQANFHEILGRAFAAYRCELQSEGARNAEDNRQKVPFRRR